MFNMAMAWGKAQNAPDPIIIPHHYSGLESGYEGRENI